MSNYIVTVVLANADPNLPPDVQYYAVNAASHREAEKRVASAVTEALLAVASRAVPPSWPAQLGEVALM